MSAVDRRAFLRASAGLGACVAGLVLLDGCGLVPSTAHQGKVPRVGYVGDSPDNPSSSALWERLGELGWVEGETTTVERRVIPAAGLQRSEIPALVAELVALPVDALLTVGTPSTIAAKLATDTIPVVFMNVRDPVGVGVVATIARPGGNVTGVSQGASTSLEGKQLELLKGVVPGLLLVAAIFYSGNPATSALGLAGFQQAAGVLGVQVQALDIGSADDLASAFATASAWPAHAIIVPRTVITLPERARIAELAERSRLPAIYGSKEFVDAGGLMSYGPNQANLYRRAATYVDKILRGAKPADLPVEQPTAFELAVNQTTAQALGLTLPPAFAAQVTGWVA